jgi:hypothetical protein
MIPSALPALPTTPPSLSHPCPAASGKLQLRATSVAGERGAFQQASASLAVDPKCAAAACK